MTAILILRSTHDRTVPNGAWSGTESEETLPSTIPFVAGDAPAGPRVLPLDFFKLFFCAMNSRVKQLLKRIIVPEKS